MGNKTHGLNPNQEFATTDLLKNGSIMKDVWVLANTMLVCCKGHRFVGISNTCRGRESSKLQFNCLDHECDSEVHLVIFGCQLNTLSLNIYTIRNQDVQSVLSTPTIPILRPQSQALPVILYSPCSNSKLNNCIPLPLSSHVVFALQSLN